MAYQIKNKDGEVVKRDGKDLIGCDFLGVVKGVSLEDRTLRILATDETVDRDGDIITMKGWRLENYIKNPVFLWAHDYSSVPIGAAIKIEKKRIPSRLVLTHKFPSLGIHPFADMILQLYYERVVNAGSVGFIPFDWEELKGDEDKTKSEEKFFFGPRKFTDQELLEHSGCAVPANPNALQDSVSRAMKSLDIKFDDKVKLFRVVTGEDILGLDEKDLERASSEIEEVISKGPDIEEETGKQIQVPEKVEKEDDSGEIKELTEENLLELINKMPGLKFSDPFVGLKNLINEILDELVAESLEDEKDIFRKRADVLLKIGAVLNRRNKSLLKQASENILEVLKDSEPDEETEVTPDGQVDLETTDDQKVSRFDVILDEGKDKVKDTSLAKAKVSKPKTDKLESKKFLVAKLNQSIETILQTVKSLTSE